MSGNEPGTPFERIRRVAGDGSEYWSARELAKVLGYQRWESFPGVVEKAQSACELSGQQVSDHFLVLPAYVSTGHGAQRQIEDYAVSRLGLYLILICSDLQKPEIMQELLLLSFAALDPAVDYRVRAATFGVNFSPEFGMSKEQKTIGTITRAFAHLNPVAQFRVSNYLIDLYFPTQRIAVECDEYGHAAYDERVEKRRQDCIRNELGCKFVRFNPDAPDFEIGQVINRIMRLVYPEAA